MAGEVRCEWGEQGIAHLRAWADVFILIDVLSFTTCVSIGIDRGAWIYPFRWRDERLTTFAAEQGAVAAQRRGQGGISLSARTWLNLPPRSRVVLPSPNGATLSLLTGQVPTLAACLRNARAVAEWADQSYQRIAVIPGGERWPDGSLRPGIEDWLGAGAVCHCLKGPCSVEAAAAADSFRAAEADLESRLLACQSGQELVDRGDAEDVRLAAQLNVSQAVPGLDPQTLAYQRLKG